MVMMQREAGVGVGMPSRVWPRTQGLRNGLYFYEAHLNTIFYYIDPVWGGLYPTNALVSEAGR